jgi:hypothetical protein
MLEFGNSLAKNELLLVLCVLPTRANIENFEQFFILLTLVGLKRASQNTSPTQLMTRKK